MSNSQSFLGARTAATEVTSNEQKPPRRFCTELDSSRPPSTIVFEPAKDGKEVVPPRQQLWGWLGWNRMGWKRVKRTRKCFRVYTVIRWARLGVRVIIRKRRTFNNQKIFKWSCWKKICDYKSCAWERLWESMRSTQSIV